MTLPHPELRWVVFIYRADGEWVGYLFVRTREGGRELCRTLTRVGCSGFVTRRTFA